jgi:predicted HD phosphohydrolase
MNRTVSFTRMADGTGEDYALLREFELQHMARLADRLLSALEDERESVEGYQVTRYEHALQAATRAARAGESEEYVVATLLHDIGDRLAPDHHGEIAAAILAPYTSAELTWIVRHHGLFQTHYYAHHYGDDRNARDRYHDHPYFASCARFCEEYDQNSFDPNYDTEPLGFFEPMVRRVFSLERRRVGRDPEGAGGPAEGAVVGQGGAAAASSRQAAAGAAVEFRDVGQVSSAGIERRGFFFADIAITAQHWRERTDDGEEAGVRVEIQLLEQTLGRSEFAATELILRAPIWRADLFTFSAAPPGNFARAHYHPSFDGRDPTERHWDPDLTRDPVSWLTGRLADLDELLATAGRPELAGTGDSKRVAAAAAAIGLTVREMLATVVTRQRGIGR